MNKHRPAQFFVLLAIIGLALATWAIVEGRVQRAETADAMAHEAEMLANALGPALASAAAASRELDEVLAWRLLDNARLIARMHEGGHLSQLGLDEIIDQNDLDSVAVVDREGAVVLRANDDIPPAVLDRTRDAWNGEAEEVILGLTTEAGVEHLTVASSIRGGGVVVVRIHAVSGRTFARRLGVENLLVGLLGSERVLYLSFREEPEGIQHQVTWDAGAIPPPLVEGSHVRELRGRSVFEVVVPIASPAGRTASLRVGLDAAPLVRSAVSATRRTVLIGIVLVAFSLALVGVALLARWRTVERAESASRLAGAEAARRRSERLASAGALAAGLAHEVRSPLNTIVVAAQRIERKHPDGECNDFASTIRSEVRRLDTVLRQFLDLARPVSEERENTELSRIAEEVRSLLSAEAEEMGLRLEPVAGSGAVVADRSSILRSVINLVHNAMEASPRGAVIELSVAEADGGVGIHVLDRGRGIDESKAQDLFDAFVTTRAEGTGLGLALVRRVAEEHGGYCRLTNRPGGGAEAVLWLPEPVKGGAAA